MGMREGAAQANHENMMQAQAGRQELVLDLLKKILARLERPSQHGCVCPVGAEQTCRGSLCPRQGIQIT